MKKPKQTPPDFRAACGRLAEALSAVVFHPSCPEAVKGDLLSACLEIANRAPVTFDTCNKFYVHLAFDALANGQVE